MPGGKIAFYTGILQQLQLNDNEVAMIMGHEVAHALLEHARERMAKSGGTELVLRGAAALFGLGGLGDLAAVGATQLLSLKFGREGESEADSLGLLLAWPSPPGHCPPGPRSRWFIAPMPAPKVSTPRCGTAPAPATSPRRSFRAWWAFGAVPR